MSISASERWAQMPDEEKNHKCLNFALRKCQEWLDTHERNETFEEYNQYTRDVIDWIAPQIGMEGLPMYYGPGKNSGDPKFRDNIDKENENA